MMANGSGSSPLSDRDYQELIAHRVREALRLERQGIRRWRFGIAITILAATLGLIGAQYRSFDTRFNVVEPLVEGYSQRPYVDGLETEFSQAERLVITGTAFAAKFRVAGEGFGTYCSYRDGNASRTGAAMNALRGDEARAARLPQVACMPNGAAGQRVGWGPQCTGTVLSWRDGQRSERVPSSLWTRMSNSCSLRSQRDALRWTSSAS